MVSAIDPAGSGAAEACGSATIWGASGARPATSAGYVPPGQLPPQPPAEVDCSRARPLRNASAAPQHSGGRVCYRAAPSMPLGKCRPCAAAAPRWPHLGRRPQARRQAPRGAPWVSTTPRHRRVERLSRRIRNVGMYCATQATRAHHAPPTSPLPSERTPRTRNVAERACSTRLGAIADR